MALFQRRRRAKANAEAPMGLVVSARSINSEELLLNMEMSRCPDGILGFFVAFVDENGELENVHKQRSGDKRETDLAQFMRLAGLTEVPTLDEVMAIKIAALTRLEEEWAPKVQAARIKGPDV